MAVIEKKCPVCDAAVISGTLYDYAKCPSCESCIYVSDRSAEDDNRAFYNAWPLDSGKRAYHPIKKKLFRFYNKKDRQRNRAEYATLDRVNDSVDRLLGGKQTVMEVGFGEGRHLAKRLESGVDAWGIDISETVVEDFQKRHPQFKDRVQVGTRFDRKADIVYCSALLEHLDDPRGFIENATASLSSGGMLVINAVPVVNDAAWTIQAAHDISFWKPCHRVIFTHRGLERMLADMGYAIAEFAAIDIFNYKLMGLHLQHGYKEMENIRHTCLKSRDLPGVFEYFKMCRAALEAHSAALVGLYVFRKN